MSRSRFLDLLSAGAAARHAAALGLFFRPLNWWFWAIVGAPTLLAGVYFFAIASDLYLSEATFIVRSSAPTPKDATSAVQGAATRAMVILQGPGSSSPLPEDTYAVREFLTSRDAVRRLEREADLRTLLTRPEGDLISRFRGILFWRDDFEALFSAYARFVSVTSNNQTGVSTLHVKAYRPEDAQQIAQALLGFSEQLINALNDRIQHDTLALFQREVDDAEQRIAGIRKQFAAYRVKEKMLDPVSAAIGPITLVGQINTQLANAKAQLAEVLENSPTSPQIPLLRTRIAALDALVRDERAKIIGITDSVAAAMSGYERLALRQLFAQKQLESEFTSLEAARLDLQSQQLYLETIAQPNLADYPLYPWRIVSFAVAVAGGLLIYGIAWMLVPGVRRHAAR